MLLGQLGSLPVGEDGLRASSTPYPSSGWTTCKAGEVAVPVFDMAWMA